MLDFTAPSAHVPFFPSPKAATSAATSMGSPTSVPEPCASTYETSPGSTLAIARASEITAACPSQRGAVKPTLRSPSLFTAEPRITAWTRSPSASASSSRFSTTAPTPLPPTKPRASASKGLHSPVGEVMPPGW